MTSLSLSSLIGISKKNTESQEEFHLPEESQNTTTSIRKRPRITFDDDYDNDNDNGNAFSASRPSLSFRELGMLDSAATPTPKKRKKTPKKKRIKYSDSEEEDEVGSLESEEVEIVFEDAPSKRDQLALKPKSKLPPVDPDSLGILYDYQPTSSLPDDLLQKMMYVLEPPLPNPFQHLSRVERLQPRSRLSKKRHQRHLQVWETPQDAKVRVLKHDRAKEWDCMKMQFKQKLYDYTKEVDIGGSVSKMAQRVLQDKYRKEKEKTERQENLKKWAAQLQNSIANDSANANAATPKMRQALLQAHERLLQEENPDDHHSLSDESSVDEQKQVLERLQQSQATEDEEKDDGAATKKLLQELETPFAKRLAYWELGKVRPGPIEFEYRDKQHLKGALVPQPRTSIDDDSDSDSGSASLKISVTDLVMRCRSKLSADAFYHFPWRRDLKDNQRRVGTQLRHSRQLRRLSYRYLCGGNGNVQVENRLIKLLQSTFRAASQAMAKSGREYNRTHHGAIRQQLDRRQGCDLKLYLQSYWKHPYDIAKRFGLVHDPRKAAHYSGYVMNSKSIGGLPDKVKLRKIGEEEMISEMPWDHEDAEYQQEPDVKGVVAYPEVAQGAEWNYLPAENSDAVVPDEAKSASDLEGLDVAARNPVSKHIAPRQSTKQDEDIWNKPVLKPTCPYIHVAGTTPPIPNFPLDAVGIVFGPVDRFAKFFDPNRLDDTFYKMTLSTLLSRMGAAKGKEERRTISTQIEKLVTQFPKLHFKSGYKFLPSRKRTDTDLPLVPCYNALMSYCSYMANGFAMKKTDEAQVVKRDDDDDLYADDDLYDDDDDTDEFMDEKDVANVIYEYCENYIGHNGLQRFPRLHLTFGLARLCKSLPNSAAEILSRPFDERNQRTPFDLFKLMLEHLELNDLIVHTPEEAVDGKMMAGELEYLIHDAAEVFQDCVKLNPVDIGNHAWHIGALSACLLLSSGNQIGSGTRLYPSAKKRKRHVAMTLEDDDSPWHEIRYMLVKYPDIRIELAEAVQLLFYLAKYQKGARTSLAISSFLEWREVIGLLVGTTESEPWDDIMALHKKHVMKWATDSMTSTSQTYFARQERDESALVQFRASELENNPGSIESWRKFVQILGPVGWHPKRRREREHVEQCNECQRLRGGLFIDHTAPNKWLGADRLKTWKLMLLQIPACPDVNLFGRKRGEEVEEWKYKACKLTEWKLKQCMPALKEPLSRLSELDDYLVFEDGDEELLWLPLDTSTEDVKPQSEKSDVERSQTFDRILPMTVVEVLNEEEEEIEFEPPQLTGPKALALEVLCYKILILCHLEKNLFDEGILTALKTLVLQSWEEHRLQEDSQEWKCLLWLCAMGLNLPLMIIRLTFPK
jgi:hypothetical protein